MRYQGSDLRSRRSGFRTRNMGLKSRNMGFLGRNSGVLGRNYSLYPSVTGTFALPVIHLAKAQRSKERKGKKRFCSSSANSAPLRVDILHYSLLPPTLYRVCVRHFCATCNSSRKGAKEQRAQREEREEKSCYFTLCLLTRTLRAWRSLRLCVMSS